jgi:hypothetical protein
LLIRLNRFRICVVGFIRDQLEFCLANHDLSRINGSYGAHIPVLEFFQNYSQSFYVFLRGQVNARIETRTSGLVEGHADPLLFAPDDVTRNVRAIRLKDKIEKIGDVLGVSNLERRPRNGYVAD